MRQSGATRSFAREFGGCELSAGWHARHSASTPFGSGRDVSLAMKRDQLSLLIVIDFEHEGIARHSVAFMRRGNRTRTAHTN